MKKVGKAPRAWRRKGGVSPVIATILMVAITVVLAAVLYVMVADWTKGAQQNPPAVTITGASKVNETAWKTDVAGASRSEKLATYKIIVLLDGNNVGWMNTTTAGTFGDIKYSDIDGGGTLSGGDRITITTTAGGDYELILFWGESRVASTAWTN